MAPSCALTARELLHPTMARSKDILGIMRGTCRKVVCRAWHLLVSILLCAGCSARDDSNSNSSWTRSRLEEIGKTIVALHNKGIDTQVCTSVEELLALAKARGFIFPKANERMQRDYWDRPLHWDMKKVKSQTTIRILSRGRDGVSHDGARDDLYVEIRFRENADPELYLKPLSY